MKITNDSEFRQAEFAFQNNQPFQGVGGYALEKALANYSSGADMISPENEASFFGKTAFDGGTASATIKKMNVNPRR